jgi:peptidoglycan hydrolase CwlO-like protein
MSTTPNVPAENKKSENKSLLIVLIVFLLLLLGAAGFLGYKFLDNSKTINAQKEEITKVTQEKETLDKDLTDLKAKYETLKGENEQLNALAEERLKEIEDLRKQLRRGGGGGGGGGKIRKEYEKLKKEYNELLEKFNSISAEVAGLKSSNERLNADLTQTKAKVEELSSTNKTLQEKVDLASALKVGNTKAFGTQVKKNGKESATDKAKKANKLECYFKIVENLITEPGDKDVYLVLKDPAGKTLSESNSNSFEYMGTEMGYTQKKTIYYSNKAMDMKMEFRGKSTFMKGTYKAEIYIDGMLADKATFELK